VNEGECTWYDFTVSIYQYLGTKMQVRPVDRGGRSNSMRRPLYSVLANTRARALGITLPHWKDALKRYLEAKAS
jgi:dTDP-4-dehydrorhamnose reductase